MDERKKAELRRLLAEMPMGDLTEAKRLISAELDQRQGRQKFNPPIRWDDRITR